MTILGKGAKRSVMLRKSTSNVSKIVQIVGECLVAMFCLCIQGRYITKSFVSLRKWVTENFVTNFTVCLLSLLHDDIFFCFTILGCIIYRVFSIGVISAILIFRSL